ATDSGDKTATANLPLCLQSPVNASQLKPGDGQRFPFEQTSKNDSVPAEQCLGEGLHRLGLPCGWEFGRCAVVRAGAWWRPEQGRASGQSHASNGFVAPFAYGIGEWEALVMWNQQGSQPLEAIGSQESLGHQLTEGLLNSRWQQASAFADFF